MEQRVPFARSLAYEGKRSKLVVPQKIHKKPLFNDHKPWEKGIEGCLSRCQ
jgi:hypothetical protein